MATYIAKGEPTTFDEGYLSDCCRFVQELLSFPPSGDVDIDLDLEAEFDYCDGGLFDGVHHKMIVNVENATWKYLLSEKDLHPFYLKWFVVL